MDAHSVRTGNHALTRTASLCDSDNAIRGELLVLRKHALARPARCFFLTALAESEGL